LKGAFSQGLFLSSTSPQDEQMSAGVQDMSGTALGAQESLKRSTKTQTCWSVTFWVRHARQQPPARWRVCMVGFRAWLRM